VSDSEIRASSVTTPLTETFADVIVACASAGRAEATIIPATRRQTTSRPGFRASLSIMGWVPLQAGLHK
jgi:hypothetical protein